MNRRRGWNAAVGVAIIVAGAACWFFARENSALATSASALRGQREGRERELARAEARWRDQRTEAAKVKAALDAAGTAVGASAAVEPKPPLAMSDLMKRATAKDEDPTAATRGRASHRNAMALRYAPLFRARGLDARQQEAFKDNLMKRDDQNKDLVDVAKERGYDPNDPAISKLRGEIYVECEAAQRALLGAEGYAAAADFERTSMLRGMVGNLAGLVAVEGAPLTSMQAEDLIRLLAEASDSYRKGGSARSTSIDWARVRAQLPAVLNETQVRAITSMEPTGNGGLHYAEWNTELVQAMKAEKEKKAAEVAGKKG